ncbi:DUF2779 domain-containing protein [Candidatus Zixiibacteriota bacterium]
MMLISKSRFISGLQCNLRIWYEVNAPGEVPEPGAATQALFDMGHEVGELAQTVFPGGQLVDWGGGLQATILQTLDLLSLNVPIYEASFMVGNTYCRVDILDPVEGSEWDLIEVKGSGEVKEVHLYDVAFQTMCARAAGISVRRSCLMHINKKYTREGDIDPEGLFSVEDITDQVSEKIPEVEERLSGFETLLRGDRPEVGIGPHCSSPYSCPLIDTCWAVLPDNPVTEYYWMSGKRTFSMINSGIKGIMDVPEDESLTSKQEIQKRCVETGEMYIDADAIQDWLAQVQYPCGFLDFETIGSAIPLYEGTRPFLQIPFQFSLHILHQEGGELQHIEFLAGDLSDPRSDLVDALALISDCRTVIAYNAGFEKGVLNRLAEQFPDQTWILEINDRMVDLLEPFRKFFIYHPDQHGSCSLKYVLPAFTDISYEDMEIASGDVAGRDYIRIHQTDMTVEEREHVTINLLEYCKQDTYAMVVLLDELNKLSRS